MRKRSVSGGNNCGNAHQMMPCHLKTCPMSLSKPNESSLVTGAISPEFWKLATSKALTEKLRSTGDIPFGWHVSKIGYKCSAAGRLVKGGIAACAQKAMESSKSIFQLCDDPDSEPSCFIFDSKPSEGSCKKTNVRPMCFATFSRGALGEMSVEKWKQIGSLVLSRTLYEHHELPSGWEVFKKGYQCGDNGVIDGNKYLKKELRQDGVGVASIQQCATLAAHIGSEQFVFCDRPNALPSCEIPKQSCTKFTSSDVSPMCHVVFSRTREHKGEPTEGATWSVLSSSLTSQGVAVADNLRAGDELRLDVSGAAAFKTSSWQFNLTTPHPNKVGADIFSFTMHGNSVDITNYRKTGVHTQRTYEDSLSSGSGFPFSEKSGSLLLLTENSGLKITMGSWSHRFPTKLARNVAFVAGFVGAKSSAKLFIRRTRHSALTSCKGRCGSWGSGSKQALGNRHLDCYCDSTCSLTGDCCDDYKETCGVVSIPKAEGNQGAKGKGCENRCGQPWIADEFCTCDPKRCECKPELCCKNFVEKCKPKTVAPTEAPCKARYQIEYNVTRCSNTRFFSSKKFEYRNLNTERDVINGNDFSIERGMRDETEKMCNARPECVGFSCWAPSVAGEGKPLPAIECRKENPRLYAKWQLCTSIDGNKILKNHTALPKATVFAKTKCQKRCPFDRHGQECGGLDRGTPKHADLKSCKCECLAGWGGPSCEEPTCAQDGGKPCGCHGKPERVGNKCVCRCDKGWSGAACTKAACPATQAGCEFTSAMSGDVPGWGYSQIPAKTAAECQDSCCKDSKCRGIQFSPSATDGAKAQCVLHDRVTIRGFSSFRPKFKDYQVYLRQGEVAQGGGMCGLQFCGGHKAGTPVFALDGSCTCACKTGYTGADCHGPVCPADETGKVCSGNGECQKISGGSYICKCKDGWSGPKCDKPVCPIGPKGELCFGNGVPTMLPNGKCECKCKPGWLPSDCSKSLCPKCPTNGQPCGGAEQGESTLNAKGECACKCKSAMWTGKSCCDTSCPMIGGKVCGGPSKGMPKLLSNGDCECEPKCPGTKVDGKFKICSGNGRHLVEKKTGECTCECFNGFSGSDCTIPKCPAGKQGKECSAPHGSPVHDYATGSCTCKCKPGYTGVACEVPECKRCASATGTIKECGGPLQGNTTHSGGKCSCQCKPGWSGECCGVPVCPLDKGTGRLCSGNGVAKMKADGSCTCVCEEGYGGKDCKIETCPRDAQGNLCSNNGKTFLDQGECKCKCKPEYTGPKCDKTTCPKDSDGNLCGGDERGATVVGSDGKCTCKCKNGFTGANCDEPKCGTCVKGNGELSVVNGKCVCKCKPGWKGPDCGDTDCPSQHGGKCSFSGEVVGDIPGWGYKTTPAKDLKDCQSKCCADTNCRAIQFSKSGVDGTSNRCVLHKNGWNRFVAGKRFKDYAVYFQSFHTKMRVEAVEPHGTSIRLPSAGTYCFSSTGHACRTHLCSNSSASSAVCDTWAGPAGLQACKKLPFGQPEMGLFGGFGRTCNDYTGQCGLYIGQSKCIPVSAAQLDVQLKIADAYPGSTLGGYTVTIMQKFKDGSSFDRPGVICGGDAQGEIVQSNGQCKCKCKNGFSGLSCETPDCDCGENGECKALADGRSKVCICKPGWKGVKCEIPVCPAEKDGKQLCCGNGKPVVAADGTCKCACSGGWKGNDCCSTDCRTTIKCAEVLEGHGAQHVKRCKVGKKQLCCGSIRDGVVTFVDGKCACKVKTPQNTSEVVGGGNECVAPTTPSPTPVPSFDVFPGWECPADELGNICGGAHRGEKYYTENRKCVEKDGKRHCGPECKCKCKPGILGKFCEVPHCPGGKPDCAGPSRSKNVIFSQGKCSCECKPGWIAPDCKKPDPKCSSFVSQLKNGTTQLCFGNGHVSIDAKGNCACTCKNGYRLPDCKYKECPKDESGEECGCKERGVVSNQADGTCKCACRDGWKGQACEVPMCPMAKDATKCENTCGGPQRGTCNSA